MGPSKRRLRVFVDTSALVAAFLSPTGAAAAVIVLHRAKVIRIIVSDYVLRELERSRRLHSPTIRQRFLAWLLTDIHILPLPSVKQVRRAVAVISWKDAPILASAKAGRIDAFVTWDKEFLRPPVVTYLGHPTFLPGEFLYHFRTSWKRFPG